ncbi:Uncharacterised protein [Janthinobacterium lividum]|uniref:hypothetical protein n=1 Tax=Janthinobacterium lividum TaxID=29581 RepID=UPI000DF9566A|nr:hypothetical protein [Janthinobacterium lividum]STR23434.1 Uncharacterised protein [Janthinobacterium lividum]
MKFKPSYDFKPLSSLSTIFKLSRISGNSRESSKIKILDIWQTEKASRFFVDNFGSHLLSFGTSQYPNDANAAASLLTVVSTEHRSDRIIGVPRELDTVENEIQAFSKFANGRATSLSIISGLYAPRLNLYNSDWSDSFNLVIGDSYGDRLLFWNARLLIPLWCDDDLCCFRVTVEEVEDPDILANIAEMLRKRARINNGSGGPSKVTISSTSICASELERIARLVEGMKTWQIINTRYVTLLSDILPKDLSDSEPLFGSHFDSSAHIGSSSFSWSPPNARPISVVPEHVQLAPIRQLFVAGYWANDVVLEYNGQHSDGSKFNRWTLPLGWRTTGAFKVILSRHNDYSRLPNPRRNRHGNLTAFVSVARPIESIYVPTAHQAITYALTKNEKFKLDFNPKVAWAEPSNEARYLIGVLGLMGGLGAARSILLHPFLRDMFSELGGTPHLSAKQTEATSNGLRGLSKYQSSFDLKNSSDFDRLTELVGKVSRSIRRPIGTIFYDELQNNWQSYRKIRFPKQEDEMDTKDEVDWDALEEGSLEKCLGELRRRKVLYQGHQWTCQKCHHRNWVDFTQLSSELPCSICKNVTMAPVAMKWQFRPNEFLIESIRDRSVLSVIWALSRLERKAIDSMIFIESMCFGYDSQVTKSSAEADLLVLIDGRTYLCEIKSSWTGVTPREIDGLVSLALRLRPDVALLAVMEANNSSKRDFSATKEKLAEANIEFEVMAWEEWDADHTPYLRSHED